MSVTLSDAIVSPRNALTFHNYNTLKLLVCTVQSTAVQLVTHSRSYFNYESSKNMVCQQIEFNKNAL